MPTRLLGIIASTCLAAGGCTEKPESAPAGDSPSAVAPDPAAAATSNVDPTANNEDLADLVKLFVAAIDRQDAILKKYAKDDTALKAGDAQPLWQAEVDAERALSRIAALSKEHPDWKATIV